MPAEGKLRRFHQQLVEAVKHLGPQFARIPVQRSPRFAEGTQEPRPLPGLLFPNLGAGGLSLLDTMELARQLGAAPLLVLSLSSPASPGHNPDLLPLTQDVLASLEFLTANSSSRWGAEREAQGQSQPLPLTHLVVGQDADCSQPWYAQAYQQLGAAVRASFPHLQLLACADLGTLPVMDGWELQAQLDPDTTARLGEALDTYQGKPLSVVLGQPHRLQGTGARPGDSVLAGLMAAARSLVLERHCDRGLLLPAQKPSQPWGKHHSLIVYSATHQPLETPAAQLHHLLRQHQGSLCAK
ncbi:alpha-L-arabinofuranosidase 1 isoform A, partial [Haematococcus lacustris]